MEGSRCRIFQLETIVRKRLGDLKWADCGPECRLEDIHRFPNLKWILGLYKLRVLGCQKLSFLTSTGTLYLATYDFQSMSES